MAFRGYELNLMMRVQDRASSRLRKLSSDIGGVNRAAQLQNKAARLAQAQNRNLLNQTKLAQSLESQTNVHGADRLANQARLNSLRASEVGYSNKLLKSGIDLNKVQQVGFTGRRAWARMEGGEIRSLSQKNAQLALRGLATQEQMIRLRTMESAAIAGTRAQLAGLVTEQMVLTAEAAATTRQYERQAALVKAQRGARSLMHVGSVATFTGAVGVAALGAAASSYANFNRESVKAATQMRGVNESFESTIKVAGVLQSGILDLTRVFPASAAEMAQSAYEIASGMDLIGNSTQRFNTSFRLLKLANQVSVAGFTDLESATSTLVTVFNNFDPQVRNADKVLNTLFATVRFGRGDFTQFSELFGGVSASANAAGQSLTEAGAALAFLTTRLPRPQAAAGYQRLIQVLGSKRFIAGFKDIFKTPITTRVNGIERLEQLSTIIDKIVSRAPRLAQGGGTALQNLIQTVTARGQKVLTGREGAGIESTAQAKRALVNLVVGWKQYRDVLNNVAGDQDEFNRSLEAAQATPGVRWQIAMNQFRAFGIIIGQTVLPVMIRFIDWLGNLVHRFEDLSPHTRHLIGKFAAISAIVMTLGGLITSMVGGLALLVLSLSAASVSAGALLAPLLMLSTLGLIAITVLIFTKWDQGSREKFFYSLDQKIIKHAENQKHSVGGIFKRVFESPIEVIARIDAKMRPNAEHDARAAARAIANAAHLASIPNLDASDRHIITTNKTTTNTILQQWRDLAAGLTGLDVFGSLSADAASASANAQLALAKAQASGNEGAIEKARLAQIAFDRQQIKRLEALPRTATNTKQLIELYNDIASNQSSMAKTAKEAATAQDTLADAMARAKNQAMDQQIDQISAAADTLVSKYKELEQANKAAFGLFTGPISQGPLAGIFNNINSTLQGFGAKPIAIPVTLQVQDLSVQNRNFDMFRRDLDALRKRGAPQELIAELQSKGVDALPLLEGLKKAGPAAFRSYVSMWKKNQALIASSTDEDMKKTLALWNTYGKDIAWQIVQGLASDKSQAILKAGYQKYIVSTFGKQLSAGIQKQVQEAVEQWMSEHKATTTKAGQKVPTSPTRSTQSVTTNNYTDNTTVHADGATPTAVKRAIDQVAFNKRRVSGR